MVSLHVESCSIGYAPGILLQRMDWGGIYELKKSRIMKKLVAIQAHKNSQMFQWGLRKTVFDNLVIPLFMGVKNLSVNHCFAVSFLITSLD